MNKTITTILSIIGALATIAALLFLFRKKLSALCRGKCCCEDADLCDAGSVETNDIAQEMAEAAAEDAAAIAEEFKDYADVEAENVESTTQEDAE